MPSVLFVCVANSCRSQMAEAAAKSLGSGPRERRRSLSRGGRWEVWSAGSHPSGQVHPVASQLMAELGLDLSGQCSKGLDAVPQRAWDYVVTMGCGDACPAVRARHRVDWDVPDPVGLPLEESRKIRDQIVEGVRRLMSPQGLDNPRQQREDKGPAWL